MTQLTMGINKWDDADHAFERGQQAYLDWCKEIAKLYAEGDATQEEIAGRYDTDQQRVSRAICIGTEKRFNTLSINSVPKDKVTLYYLTTLPDKEFKEYCKPTTTQAVILEHKRRLAAPPPAPVAPRPKCPGVEGIGPGLWKWSEAWGSWEQQPTLAEVHASIDARNSVPPPAPKPIVDGKAVLRAEFEQLLTSQAGLKALRRMFSSLYHPDKAQGNTKRLAAINQAFDLLEH